MNESTLETLISNVANVAASLAVLIRDGNVPPNKAEALVTLAMSKSGMPDAQLFRAVVNRCILPAVVKAIGDADRMLEKYRPRD